MKPSERRALDAEKRAREAAEYREKELKKQAEKAAKKAARKENRSAPHGSENGEDVAFSDSVNDTARGEGYYAKNGSEEQEYKELFNADATYTKLPEEEIEVKGDGYHRESFFSNHARLIAFIVTAVVVIFVIGPLGLDIYFTIQDVKTGGVAVEGVDLTPDELIELIETKGVNVKWDDFGKYNYTSYREGRTREFAIEGTNVTLRVEKAKDSAFPDIVRLIDYGSSEFIDDVRSVEISEIEEFLEAHSKSPEKLPTE